MRKFVRVASGTDPVGLPVFVATDKVVTVGIKKNTTGTVYYYIALTTDSGFTGNITTNFATVDDALTAVDRYFDIEDPDDGWKTSL